jgi:formate hydrogenlyase subunit 4
MNFTEILCFIVLFLVLPILISGFIRNLKARLQNRIGSPLLQPLYNLYKLLQKSETISQDASPLFRIVPALNFSIMLILAVLVPWLPFHFSLPGSEIFLVLYLFAAMRFFSIIAALDTGSPFSAFGASREATLSALTEPAIILSLVALGIAYRTSDLNEIFSFSQSHGLMQVSIWLLSGAGLFLASLVELSRMPIDDPTTHLELTMVHEAMVIENSGPNLALIELAYNLRLVVYYGLSAQCFMHALAVLFTIDHATYVLLSILAIFILAFLTAAIESFAVKLAWRNNPEFIAYALTMSLLASLAAIFQSAFASLSLGNLGAFL